MKAFSIIAVIAFILILISWAANYSSGESGEAIAFLALWSLFIIGMQFIKCYSRRKGTKALSLTEDQAEPVSGNNQT